MMSVIFAILRCDRMREVQMGSTDDAEPSPRLPPSPPVLHGDARCRHAATPLFIPLMALRLIITLSKEEWQSMFTSSMLIARYCHFRYLLPLHRPVLPDALVQPVTSVPFAAAAATPRFLHRCQPDAGFRPADLQIFSAQKEREQECCAA